MSVAEFVHFGYDVFLGIHCETLEQSLDLMIISKKGRLDQADKARESVPDLRTQCPIITLLV